MRTYPPAPPRIAAHLLFLPPVLLPPIEAFFYPVHPICCDRCGFSCASFKQHFSLIPFFTTTPPSELAPWYFLQYQGTYCFGGPPSFSFLTSLIPMSCLNKYFLPSVREDDTFPCFSPLCYRGRGSGIPFNILFLFSPSPPGRRRSRLPPKLKRTGSEKSSLFAQRFPFAIGRLGCPGLYLPALLLSYSGTMPPSLPWPCSPTLRCNARFPPPPACQEPWPSVLDSLKARPFFGVCTRLLPPVASLVILGQTNPKNLSPWQRTLQNPAS